MVYTSYTTNATVEQEQDDDDARGVSSALLGDAAALEAQIHAADAEIAAASTARKKSARAEQLLLADKASRIGDTTFQLGSDEEKEEEEEEEKIDESQSKAARKVPPTRPLRSSLRIHYRVLPCACVCVRAGSTCQSCWRGKPVRVRE